MFQSVKRGLLDTLDIIQHARDFRQIAKALVPASLAERHILNPGSSSLRPHSPQEIGSELRQLRNQLKLEAIDAQGRVGYSNLRQGKTFLLLEKSAQNLTHLSPRDFDSDAERLAFWINLYNVLAIHGVIQLGIERSVMEIPSFFSTVAYRVGGQVFTLDEIENGVLRRNGRHPATRRRLFKSDDLRLAYCPTQVDPRIHSALVCASASCPPVAFYDPEKIDEQLQQATENYIRNDVKVHSSRRVIEVPITFRYYAEDWGNSNDIQRFILEYATDDQRAALQQAFHQGYSFDFRRYDWSLNSVV